MRRHDRGDRRLIRLTLTKKGHGLVDAVTKRRRAEIADLLEAIPSEQQAALVDSLQRLTAAAGEVPEQDWSTGGISRCDIGTRDGLQSDHVAGHDDPHITLVGWCVLSAEVADPRRTHRNHGRCRRHRVLRGTAGLYPLLPRDAGRLSRADADGRGRTRCFGVVHPTVGPPTGRRTGSTARGDPRVSIRPRSGGPRHRCGDLGGPSQSARHPVPRRHRQDRGVSPHHRLGRLGRSRGPHRTDQRRVRFPARPRVGPQPSRRPHRRGHRASARGSGPSSAPHSVARSWPPRSCTGTTSTRRLCFLASWPRWSATSSSVPWSGSRRSSASPASYHFTDPAQLAVVCTDRCTRWIDRPALRQELLWHR